MTNTEVYLSDNYVTLDFETTNIEKGDAFNETNRILLSVIKQGNTETHTVCWGNQYEIQEVIHAVEQADFLVAQNAKFELQWLERAGLDLSGIVVFDTMIADCVIHGNLTVPLDLGSIAQRYGYPGKEPYVDICIKSGVCPSTLPRSLLKNRCIYDVNVTEAVFKKQLRILQDTNRLGVLYTRCLITPVLADIEKNGMRLDADKVNDEYNKTCEELDEVNSVLHAMCGEINLNSTKQLAELLYETLGFSELTKRGVPVRTPAGKKKTDSGTILQLTAKTKQQKDFINYKQKQSYLNAKLTKSLSKFKECVDNNDLLQATFNQCRTKTHRLSSSGKKYKIQFQNQGRELKPLFTARHSGWLVGEADGSQLEFRVAAYLGNDAQAKEDIGNKVDVHSATAEKMTSAGQPTNRQEAKSRTFKPLYGGTSGTPAEQAYYKYFKERYNGIAKAQDNWIATVLAKKQLTIENGFTFFWPDTKIQKSGFVTNTQNICNYPVQSFATADIIPIALYYVWASLKKANAESFIVNTVHDSVVIEIHPDEVELVRDICVDSFTTKVYNYLYDVYKIKFDVSLGIGFKVGTHWATGTEVSFNVTSPYQIG